MLKRKLIMYNRLASVVCTEKEVKLIFGREIP